MDEAPFTSCMGGTLGQGPSSMCYVLSQVLHFWQSSWALFYQVLEERGARGCACELPVTVQVGPPWAALLQT